MVDLRRVRSLSQKRDSAGASSSGKRKKRRVADQGHSSSGREQSGSRSVPPASEVAPELAPQDTHVVLGEGRPTEPLTPGGPSSPKSAQEAAPKAWTPYWGLTVEDSAVDDHRVADILSQSLLLPKDEEWMKGLAFKDLATYAIHQSVRTASAMAGVVASHMNALERASRLRREVRQHTAQLTSAGSRLELAEAEVKDLNERMQASESEKDNLKLRLSAAEEKEVVLLAKADAAEEKAARAEERATRAVEVFRSSAEYDEDRAKDAVEAYEAGLADYKKAVLLAFPDLDLSSIQVADEEARDDGDDSGAAE